MKIAVLDNYDSFTYNLVHAIEKITHKKPDVFFNDKVDIAKFLEYDKIVLSPGPGIPEEAGILISLIKKMAKKRPILGICLGHQAIGEAFGATLINLDYVYHGVATTIIQSTNSEAIFKGIPETFEAGRYHSWIVNRNNFPKCLDITAIDKEAQIMAMKHKEFDVTGLQFHPESILTPYGEKMLENWIKSGKMTDETFAE